MTRYSRRSTGHPRRGSPMHTGAHAPNKHSVNGEHTKGERLCQGVRLRRLSPLHPVHWARGFITRGYKQMGISCIATVTPFLFAGRGVAGPKSASEISSWRGLLMNFFPQGQARSAGFFKKNHKNLPKCLFMPFLDFLVTETGVKSIISTSAQNA